LPPRQTFADHRRGQRVGRDAVRHRDPQRGVIPRVPRALRDGDRREVVVVERRRGQRLGMAQLDAAVVVLILVRHATNLTDFGYPRGVTTRSTRASVKSSELVTRTASIAADVAAKHAADVDANSRFPHETFAALKQAKLLSAAVPAAYGGHGAGMLELGHQCAALAQGCGSSAMVLAMHHIQVACIARHGRGTPYFDAYLRDKLVG